MFGGRNRRANKEEQNADHHLLQAQPQNKKGARSSLVIHSYHTNQNGVSRPPNSISYASPTSSRDGDSVQFESRTDTTTQRMKEPTSRYTSMDNQRDTAQSYKDISTNSLARLEKLDPAHPMVAGRSRATHRSRALDLKHNDNSYHVVATLIVDRFEEQLSNENVKSFIVTAGDMYHMNRVVPDKKGFIEAVQYRFMSCPEDSSKPIHLVTRQCHALGLDRKGEYNLLHAPIGSNFQISETKKPPKKTKVNTEAVQNAKPNTPDELARQQLTTELQEASNLMAESVTPEASQFWRNQVMELQTKLRALHGKGIESPSLAPSLPTNKSSLKDFKAEEGVLSSMWQNIGYVPPIQDKRKPVTDPLDKTIEKATSPVTSPSRHSVIEKELPVVDVVEKELPIVDVVAPADLPGGYQFEAELNGKRFLATVPSGGVQKGKTFYCYMEETNDAGILLGRWRDKPIDLFKHGAYHPMVLNSILCPLLALAQVMERVGLDITGQKAPSDTPHHGLWSPRGMALSMSFVWAGLNTTIIFGFVVKLLSYVSLSAGDILSLILVNVSFLAYTVYATINTRTYLMERYQIPVGRFGSRIESLLSAMFFPLSIAQMGRHTATYDNHEGVCCHATGIVEHEEP